MTDREGLALGVVLINSWNVIVNTELVHYHDPARQPDSTHHFATMPDVQRIATMPDVQRIEAFWMRTVGVLLILLGLTLILSPHIEYTAREKIAHTKYSVKNEKTIVIPIPVALAAICAGVIILLLSKRKT